MALGLWEGWRLLDWGFGTSHVPPLGAFILNVCEAGWSTSFVFVTLLSLFRIGVRWD